MDLTTSLTNLDLNCPITTATKTLLEASEQLKLDLEAGLDKRPHYTSHLNMVLSHFREVLYTTRVQLHPRTENEIRSLLFVADTYGLDTSFHERHRLTHRLLKMLTENENDTLDDTKTWSQAVQAPTGRHETVEPAKGRAAFG